MRKYLVLVVLALGLVAGSLPACSGSQKAEPVTTIKHDSLNIDGAMRLSDVAVPKHYELDLTIDPSSEQFEGTTRINIDLSTPQRVLYLHGEDLNIEALTLVSGTKEVGGEAVFGANGGMAVILNEEAPAGEATLVFKYTAPFKEGLNGLYRVKEEGLWYAYTQFEPLDARRAFPGFDEPKFKTTYRTTMRVPAGMVALTNTKETDRVTEGNLEVFRFEVSKPMPTYLVAFAVGDFDILESEEPLDGVTLRLVAPKGKGVLGEYMLKRTPAVVRYLTEYFGQPFPYEKLDIVAVPNFSAGAMENIGLVTFRDSLLLLDSETASVAQRRSALSVMIHELAHMWFGNLVTMPWWDDLWLNESFATWMAAKGLVDLAPQLESSVDAVSGKGWVMMQDARKSARNIRNPIETVGDIHNAFDSITYGKGARVLQMFEVWMGPEKMQEALRAYTSTYANQGATTEQLLAELDKASGKPVGEALKTFLDQPGTPSVHVDLICEDKPVLKVTQKRWLPAGSDAPNQGLWQVPLCVRYEQRGRSEVHCELITQDSQNVALEATRCPKWFYPNANESGYWRWTMSEDALNKLSSRYLAELTTEEKVGLQSNLSAMLASEQIPPDTYLKSMEALGRESNRTLLLNTLGAMEFVNRFVTDEQRAKWTRKMSALTARRMRSVGYLPKANDAAEKGLLRARLFDSHFALTQDPKAKEEAQKIADAFLKDMKTVPADVAGVALEIVAREGTADLWLSLKLALEGAPTPAARSAIIRALGSFKDKDLHNKSLGLYLEGTIRTQDLWAIMGPSFSDDTTFANTWNWFTSNYSAIVEKAGQQAASNLPRVASGFCSADGAEKARAFFAGRPKVEGQERILDQTVEAIQHCERQKKYLENGLPGYLK